MSAHDTARKIVELAAQVGRHGSVNVLGSCFIAVRVIDVKQSYGKTRFCVTPLMGEGHAWVENVNFYAEPK